MTTGSGVPGDPRFRLITACSFGLATACAAMGGRALVGRSAGAHAVINGVHNGPRKAEQREITELARRHAAEVHTW